MIVLERIKRTDCRLLKDMSKHYSQPKGFVGRNICYAITFNGKYYGSIVAGSATKHLPNRNKIIGNTDLNCIANNIFFHVEGPYPIRNFVKKILQLFRLIVWVDWFVKYGDKLKYFETLVELPRTGECYIRDGWRIIGQTKGFTCKRVSGKGTDNWSGKRIWDTKNLRPKHVLIRECEL